MSHIEERITKLRCEVSKASNEMANNGRDPDDSYYVGYLRGRIAELLLLKRQSKGRRATKKGGGGGG